MESIFSSGRPGSTASTSSEAKEAGGAIHSGAHGLQIVNNQFHDTGDQDIDGEGSEKNIDWLISRNTFSLGSARRGISHFNCSWPAMGG